MLLAGDSNVWLPPFHLGKSRQADSSLVPIIQEMMEWHSSVLQNPLDVPTHRCGAALDIIFATRSLSCHGSAVHCGSIRCSVALCCPWSTFPSLFLPAQASPPPCLAFATASCHASLTEWHQSVLSPSSAPLNAFPLWALSSAPSPRSFDGASLHSRRRPATTPCTRRRQPLWWNDACFRALVARNGSWRDFRRLRGSHSFPLSAAAISQH